MGILCAPEYEFLCNTYDLSKRGGSRNSYLFRSRRTPENPEIEKRYQSRMSRAGYLFRTRRAEEDEDEPAFDRPTRGKNYLFRTRKADKNRGYLFRTR